MSTPTKKYKIHLNPNLLAWCKEQVRVNNTSDEEPPFIHYSSHKMRKDIVTANGIGYTDTYATDDNATYRVRFVNDSRSWAIQTTEFTWAPSVNTLGNFPKKRRGRHEA